MHNTTPQDGPLSVLVLPQGYLFMTVKSLTITISMSDTFTVVSYFYNGRGDNGQNITTNDPNFQNQI